MAGTIITIGRQYGSGGRSTGKELSKMLGIPFYDRAIVDLAAKESGLDADFISDGEQKVTASMLFNIAAMNYCGYFTDATNTLTDKIYLAESKVITSIASEGPCVIVGRCADYILRDGFNVFKVFMYASDPIRAERIMKEQNISEKEALKLLRQSDKRRSRHYEHYTGLSWGQPEHYDLMIDGGKIPPETAAKLIATAIAK